MTAARRPDPTPDESWHVDRGRTVRPWPGEEARAQDDAVTIDCDTCTVRGWGCGDCVVTVLLGGPPYGVELDGDEQRALEALADGGLVPPLRMSDGSDDPGAGHDLLTGPWGS